jgi:hypothetical protein
MNHIASTLLLKCPKCSKGDLFSYKGMFRYTHMLDMPDNCPHCGQKYCIEPGFWLGALWTSYPIVILTELPFLIGALVSKTISPFWFFGGMLIAFVFVYPVMLRLGRSIWIHINIRKLKNN